MSTQSQPVIPVTMSYGYNGNNNNSNYHLQHEMHRNADHIANHLSQNEARDAIAYSETRQNIERNSDQLQNQLNANSIANLLATQNAATSSQLGVYNSATATQLGIYNASTATQLGIQNTATSTQLGIQNTSTATQLGIQNTSTAIQLGIRDSLAVTSANLAALSVQVERINGLNVVESKNIQVNQGRDLGASQLLAAQQFGTLQLQASENKGYLSEKITYSSEKGIATMNTILAKISECCCENKMLHAETRNSIIANELANLRARR